MTDCLDRSDETNCSGNESVDQSIDSVTDNFAVFLYKFNFAMLLICHFFMKAQQGLQCRRVFRHLSFVSPAVTVCCRIKFVTSVMTALMVPTKFAAKNKVRELAEQSVTEVVTSSLFFKLSFAKNVSTFKQLRSQGSGVTIPVL